MKINKIIIAENKEIFLDFVKKLDFKNIKTTQDVIFWEKERENSGEKENLVLVYSEDEKKVIEFLENKYIYVEKYIFVWIAEILSNKELLYKDIIIPNTFIWKQNKTYFLDSIIWKDYDMKRFWLILNWICAESSSEKLEFQADIKSQKVFKYLEIFSKKDLLEKFIVIFQVGEGDFENLVAITDMVV